jgi:hypothetical protein
LSVAVVRSISAVFLLTFLAGCVTDDNTVSVARVRPAATAKPEKTTKLSQSVQETDHQHWSRLLILGSAY